MGTGVGYVENERLANPRQRFRLDTEMPMGVTGYRNEANT
jgi:hypothetical protein